MSTIGVAPSLCLQLAYAHYDLIIYWSLGMAVVDLDLNCQMLMRPKSHKQ